jgi:hypothetical protein
MGFTIDVQKSSRHWPRSVGNVAINSLALIQFQSRARRRKVVMATAFNGAFVRFFTAVNTGKYSARLKRDLELREDGRRRLKTSKLLQDPNIGRSNRFP